MMQRYVLSVFFLLLFGLPPCAQAQIGKLDVQADSLNFEQEENVVTASGNVRLRKGNQSLSADVVTYNTVTEQAYAKGNVVFTNGNQVWKGEELSYNFITQEGSFPQLSFESAPFKGTAENSQQLSPIHTRMETVTVTTCEDLESPEFSMTAGKVDLYEESIVVLHHPVFRFHGVPVFYLPRLTLDPEREPTHIDVIPGYNSRDGATLITRYHQFPTPNLRSTSRIDYRVERGFAFGQEFVWFDEEKRPDVTEVSAYFALDDRPYKNDEEEEALRSQGVDLDEERYRLHFLHRKRLGERDSLYLKAAYWSDPRIVRDFFREDYRQEPIPETRATYSTFGDWWSADIEISRQLNESDFDGFNRLPEATFTVPRLRLGESDFLYESETRGGFLQRTFSDFNQDNGNEDYETLRAHTEHMFYLPTRQMGWLNVVPRAGMSATYYGETVGQETTVTQVSNVNTNNVILTSLETNTVDVAQSAELRVSPEIGVETSFKAFGLVHNNATTLGQGLRHVIEPFANYTFRPEPNVEPENLYQFDSIDELDESHFIELGVRNKWQTKRMRPNGRHRVHDLVNLNLVTSYDLRSDADRNLGDLVADLELSFVEWMTLRMEAEYNPEDSLLEEMQTEIRLRDPETLNSLTLNQRYREDRDHTLQLSYDLNPRGKTGLTGYTRYELEDDGFEEQQILFRIETDCVGYGIGGKWIKGDVFSNGTREDDEYEIWFQFWLTAFPNSILGTGGVE